MDRSYELNGIMFVWDESKARKLNHGMLLLEWMLTGIYYV